MSIYDRSEKLLGAENINKIKQSRVFIAGLGGVGSYAMESLIRSGVGEIGIADFDTVDISNLNRQLETLQTNIGQKKVDIFEQRAKEINPYIVINKYPLFIRTDNIDLLQIDHYDLLIDCIDSVEGKLAMWKYCQNHNIPFISSLGMANRINPTNVKITKLNKTTDDPLARKLRHQAKEEGLDLNIDVVFSSEIPLKVSENKQELGSMIFVPAEAGLCCGYWAINYLINRC